MTKDMTQGSPTKLILAFWIPMLFGYLLQQVYGMVDTRIVGRFLGVEALAAVGATGSINFLVLGFCTYIIPYALVQYYPLLYLLGKTDRWWYALYPFGAVLFLLLSYVLWRYGIRNYKSTGS